MSGYESEGTELNTQALVDEALAMHQGAYRREMEKSLECISPEMKAEYTEALRVCPEVVEAESGHLMFLRRENFNYWAAAMRLVSYWKFRKGAFRADAFLPLLQLPQSSAFASGTQSCNDVAHALELEVISVLPPDERGRSVLCFDASRLEDITLEMDSLRRLCFYFGHIVAKNDRSHSEGIVFLALFSRKPPAISYGYRSLLDIIVQALPVKLKRILLVQKSPESLSCSEFLEKVVPNVLGFMGSSLESLSLAVSGETMKDVYDALTSLGLQSKTVTALMLKGSSQLNAATGNEDHDDDGLRRGTVTHSYQQEIPPGVSAVQDKGSGKIGLRKDRAAIDTSTAPDLPPESPLATAKLCQEPNNEESEALDRMEEALLRIPGSEKAAYLEVLKAAPQLIPLESPPLRFLRFECLDPLAAARRLVIYWRMRKASFAERFCLPLSVADGPSALSDFDKKLLGHGGFCFLSRDQQGRVIFLNNSARSEFVSDERDRTQRGPILFYWVQVASELSAEVVVINIFTPRGVSPRNIQFFLELMQHGAPVRIVQSNVCIICPKSGWRSYMEAAIPRLMQGVPKYVARSLTIHIASTRKDMLGRLEAAGFLDCKLPDCLGGSWTYENDYATWLRDRAELDASRYSQIPTCAIAVEKTANLIQMALDAGKKPEELGFLGIDSTRNSSKIGVPFELTPRDFRAKDVKKLAASEISRAASPPSFLQNPISLSATSISDSEVPKPGATAPIHCCYKKAVASAPDLVASESPESTFVRYAGGTDLAFASELMESYWMMRESLFGDRTFLAMNQTGEGTMTQADCKLLSEGYIVLLQPDKARRPVVCIDPSKLSSHDSQTDSLQRVVFYMGSVLSETSAAQTDGCVVVLCSTRFSSNLRRLLDETFRILLTSLPIHLHSVHIVGTHQRCNQADFNSFVHDAISVLGSYAAVQTMTHFCASEASLAHHLEHHGLTPASLPEGMGGNWAYSRLADWIDARIRYEWGLPSRKELCHGAAPIPSYKAAPLSECSEEEKQERTRRLHMLHSRRRRGRMKVEVHVLEAQVDDILRSNQRLRDENQFLEDRITCAKEFLASNGLL